MIRKLHNSKNELYYNVKNLITSGTFHWFYNEFSTHETSFDGPNYCNDSFYSHSFLLRPDPGHLYPTPSSNYLDQVQYFLYTLLKENNINAKCFYRINANSMHPSKNNKLTIPHYDHDFPHKNLLVYLTDAGGETVVFNGDSTTNATSEHYPEEDDVIIFEGLHCCRPPKEKRRIVIVATFLSDD